MENLLNATRAAFRLFLFFIIISVYLIWSYLCHLLIRVPEQRQARFSKNASFFCGLMLRVFGVELNILNRPDENEKFLLVSNHMGFIDILLISSVSPTLFVTSVEMRETPVLGLITEMGGCMYVERRNRTNIGQELQSMVVALQKGFRIVLYPEATSTNGERVLPFKRTLMMAAAHAEVPIQPVVVNFREVNGERFSLKWRDHLCWYGDIPFAVSLWRSMTLKTVKAEIEFLDKIYSKPEDDRGQIADKAHALISQKFVPVID